MTSQINNYLILYYEIANKQIYIIVNYSYPYVNFIKKVNLSYYYIYIYKYDHYDILKIIHKNMSNTIEIIKGLFEN